VQTPTGTDDDEPKTTRWFEIVGVVQNLQENAFDSTLLRAVVYYAVDPAQAQTAQLEVRTRPGSAGAFGTKLRSITVAVNPALRLGRTVTRDEFDRQATLVVRLVALGIGLVLVSVFLLSAGGIYALTSFTVTRRRKEIGIRAALGANPQQVLAAVFGRVARQVALGLVIGLGGAVVMETVSGGEILGGRAALLLPVFGALMTMVAVVAAFGPARRGLRIEPTEALRAES
jgi:ABC-type antimicrobial peptide transport system permease subunit